MRHESRSAPGIQNGGLDVSLGLTAWLSRIIYTDTVKPKSAVKRRKSARRYRLNSPTTRVNAQYMQVSTRVEENACNAPAWSSRSGSSPPTIASVKEKLQSALQKSRIDRATALGPPGRAGVEHWDGAVRCV